MTLKFSALNILILILYRILDFVDFRIAWNFFVIVVVIVSFLGIFLIVS